MRRKRRDEDEAPRVPSSSSVTGVRPVPSAPRLVVPPPAPVVEPEPVVEPVTFAPPAAEAASEPAAEPEPRTVELADPVGLDDLERGRTVALLAALGRIQLTLDLLERRVGRIEERLDRVEEAAGPLPQAPLDVLRGEAEALPADLGDGGVEAAGEGEPAEDLDVFADDAFENDADAELPTEDPEAPAAP